MLKFEEHDKKDVAHKIATTEDAALKAKAKKAHKIIEQQNIEEWLLKQVLLEAADLLDKEGWIQLSEDTKYAI
jgi:hypothetical protein